MTTVPARFPGEPRIVNCEAGQLSVRRVSFIQVIVGEGGCHSGVPSGKSSALGSPSASISIFTRCSASNRVFGPAGSA